MLRLINTVILILALFDTAHAHFVWLERDGDSPARAYFGEWIDDIRERTGCLLDRFKAPRVFIGASDEPLPVKERKQFGVCRQRPRRCAFRGQQRSAT
jgi:hypothetical protein